MNRIANKGFSLIEILAVITIISALSILVLPRLAFTGNGHSKPTLVNALNLARYIALYTSEKEDQVHFLLIDNKISITKNNIDVINLGIDYPNTISNEIKHEPDSVLLFFNTLGETQAAQISLLSDSGRVFVNINKTGHVE